MIGCKSILLSCAFCLLFNFSGAQDNNISILQNNQRPIKEIELNILY